MKISKMKGTETGHGATLHLSIWFDYAPNSLFPIQDQQKADQLVKLFLKEYAASVHRKNAYYNLANYYYKNKTDNAICRRISLPRSIRNLQ